MGVGVDVAVIAPLREKLELNAIENGKPKELPKTRVFGNLSKTPMLASSWPLLEVATISLPGLKSSNGWSKTISLRLISKMLLNFGSKV